MPRQTNRREVLADAVIRVLARDGAHGLTHRAVDAEAQVPVGTTSRYFRTRSALLEVAAETVRNRHTAYVQRIAEPVGRNRAGLIDALAALIADSETTNRDLYVARFELILASLRSDRLRAIMGEVRSASLEAAGRFIRAAGIELPKESIDLLGSLLVGISLDRITLERPHVADEAIAEQLVRALTPTTGRPAESAG